MKFKALRINNLVSLISLIITILLCEFVVRIMELAPEVVYIKKGRMQLSKNPKIGYEPIPNLDSTGKPMNYYAYRGQSNSMGFRDYDHTLKKTPGSERIIVLGDSVTQGLWITDDNKVYPRVIEQELQNKGFNIDVMNFGVSGYNTQQEIETLKDKGLKFDPNLVILGYCLNDKWRDDGGIYGILLREEQKVHKSGRVNQEKLNPIVKHSDLLRFLKFVVFRPEHEIPLKSQDLTVNVNSLYKDSVATYFAELKNLSIAHNFDVLILIFPDFGKNDENLIKGWESYEFVDEHRKVIELAREYNLPYLDLYKTFSDCRKEINHQISYDRFHPNPMGNVCLGKKLANYLVIYYFSKKLRIDSQKML